MNIPTIIHHVWVSGDEMPDSVLRIRQTWIDRHPGWAFRVWQLEDLRWLRNQSLFDRSIPYSQKSDFARYEVVHRFGGVYLDTDVECLRPIDRLLDGCEFFAGREPNGKAGSAIFGSTPAHPITQQMIERLPASCFVHPIEQLGITSGPHLLDRTIRDGRWEGRRGVRIFPPAYFYPYAGGQPWRPETSPRAYAVHHWNHSWKDQTGVTVTPADLLPSPGEAAMPSARALWREVSDRAAAMARRRLLTPVKRLTKEALERAMPASVTAHGIPWGPGEVLVATPFDTRLLCPTDDLSVAPGLALNGTNDDAFVDLLSRWRLHLAMTFVDVGANVGFSTILGAARVGRFGRVFAYECNPELVRFLQRNLEMNRFDDRVRLVEKAAHRDDEDRRLQVTRHLNGLGSLAPLNGRKDLGGDLQEFEVACERLDAGLRGTSYIDLLKIDVSGGEAAVLDGASGLLDEGKVGVIMIPVRDDVLRGEQREEMEKALTSLVEDRGAIFHAPRSARVVPLDEILTVFRYPALFIRLPGASIQPW